MLLNPRNGVLVSDGPVNIVAIVDVHFLCMTVFKKKCPQNILERVERVMSQRYHIFYGRRVIYIN
jgi:hypothetical protein